MRQVTRWYVIGRGLLASVSAFVLLISFTTLPATSVLTKERSPSTSPLAIISEGVEHVGADVWHEAGLRGQGVKIAALDAGFEDYDERIEQGELPPNVITHTFTTSGFGTSGGKNGTVMAEIAFDLAPEAQFYLVDTLPSDVDQFNQAVDWLIEQEVDIILYARNWLVGSSGDGRGPLTTKINQATDRDILWVNSAGDSAQRHWEGGWKDEDGCPEALDPGQAGGGCMDFDVSDNWNDIPNVAADQLISVGLTWDDLWEMNAQFDYNLALSFQKRPTDWVSSHDPGFMRYPVESIVERVPDAGTYNVAITRPPDETGTTRLELFLGWDPGFEFEHKVITSSIMTPADAHGALVVGAADWRDDNLYDLSSRGPTNDGRTKPDLVAPHGVRTVTYGVPAEGARCPQPGSGACGSGTAAAHVAGAAALVKLAFPSFTSEEIADFLKNRAIDLGPSGADNEYGWGRLQLGPPPGQEATPTPTPTPTATAQPPTVTPTPTVSPSPSPTPTPTPGMELGVKLYLPVILRK